MFRPYPEREKGKGSEGKKKIVFILYFALHTTSSGNMVIIIWCFP